MGTTGGTGAIGASAEALAAQWLDGKGLTLVARNVRCKAGELDLIMRDAQGVIFVEVRARASRAFGGAAASVGFAKQQRLKRAAQWWLLRQYGDRPWPAMRFDVVCVEPSGVQWIHNAL